MIDNYWGLNIPKAEEKYNAKYIGDFSITNDTPIAVFYVENPDTSKGHSNYFGLYGIILQLEPDIQYQWMICNAIGVLNKTYPANKLPNGELLISTYPHDYKTKELDGIEYMIDGGNAGYTRYSPLNANIVQVKVIKDKLIEI